MASEQTSGWSNKIWDRKDLTKSLDRILLVATGYHRWASSSFVSIDSLPPDEHDRQCPICSITYGEPVSEHIIPVVEQPQKLPCGHHFGNFCISLWLPQSNTCPLCRHKDICPLSGTGFYIDPLRQYMIACRQWLLWIIKRHGVPRAVALDREFQFRLRIPLAMSWEQWKSITGNKGFMDRNSDMRLILQHHVSINYNAADQPVLDFMSPLLNWWGGPPKEVSWELQYGCLYKDPRWGNLRYDPAHWDAEFGDKDHSESWGKLRYDRILQWIDRGWKALEMLFFTMAAGQITKEDLEAYEDDMLKGDLPWDFQEEAIKEASKWRLSLTTDTLLYGEWLAI